MHNDRRTKRWARSQATNAIKRGAITKEPCAVCGALRVEAHHEDYTQPLDIVWLCRKHHIERHKEMETLTADFIRPIGTRELGNVIKQVIQEIGKEDIEAIVTEVKRRLDS